MSEAKPKKLIEYIWESKNGLHPLADPKGYGQWQFGDGESSQGGARTEEEAWEQLYHGIRIARQRGVDVSSIEVVFSEPAPVSEMPSNQL